MRKVASRGVLPVINCDVEGIYYIYIVKLVVV
jgi:hypothetical protein